MIVVAVSLCLIYVWVLYLIHTAPTEDEFYDSNKKEDNDNLTKFED
jgi:hypothetical protein